MSTDQNRKGCIYWTARVSGGLSIVLILLLAAGYVYGRIAISRDQQAYPPPGQLVDVGGHHLHLHCMGEGAPTVLLEAGLGDWSLAWRLVQDEIARFTQACSYDRAGLGWSESSLGPRTGAQIAAELHALLRAAEIPEPYVLVGHSAGGMYARIYADRYPETVAGLVLIDAPDEQNALPPYAQSMEGQARVMSWLAKLGLFYSLGLFLGDDASEAEFLPAYVGKLDPADRERYMVRSLHSFDALAAEWAAFADSLARLRAVAPLADVPVAVLAARRTLADSGRADPYRSPLLPAETLYHVVEDSGHHIQVDRPEVVVDVVRQVVEEVRVRLLEGIDFGRAISYKKGAAEKLLLLCWRSRADGLS